MNQKLALMIVLMSSATAVGAGDNPAPSRPLLLELFTSESCSSCPPADAYIASLQGRTDVLPLSLHVNYWDELGWKDHYSSAQFTHRQQDYSARLGAQVYTPQLVIDGIAETVGSDRGRAEMLIRQVRLQMTEVPATIRRNDQQLHVDVAASPAHSPIREARLLLITFDPVETDSIGGGENRGRTIIYHNVVRSLRNIGAWSGQALSLDEMLQGSESGKKVLLALQDQSSGRILGVAAAF